jgi:tetratricopeptide (TPR) repeat protein
MRKLSITISIICLTLGASFISIAADTETTIRNLQAKYKDAKKNYYTNIRLGYLYYSIKKYANADFHYQNAGKIKPKSIEPLLGLYYVNIALKQYKKAETCCKNIIRIDSCNYFGTLYFIYAQMGQKKYMIAKKYALKMLQIYPADVTLLYTLKNIYTALQLPEEAKKIQDIIVLMTENSSSPSEQVIRNLLVQYDKNKNNYYINIRLGYLYCSLKQYKKSESYYKQASQIKNKSIEPYLGLYNVYTALKQYKQAAKACRAAVKIDPNNYYGNLYLTYSLAWLRQYSAGKRYAVKMVKLYPSDISFLTILKNLNKYMIKTKDENRIQGYINQLK